MPASDTFVIAGGGLAGAKAAEALREQGFDGRIVLAAEEDIRPYERPPLSKDYLQGKAEPRHNLRALPGLVRRQRASSCCSARRSPGSTGAAGR